MAASDASAAPALWVDDEAGLLARLGSSARGLSATEAGQRLIRWGANRVHAGREETRLRVFARQFKSPIVIILLFACGLAALLSSWSDCVIIVAIVVASAVLSFRQEYRASTAVKKLRAQLVARARVLRDGVELNIDAEAVVPGDVVCLGAGSLVPADGRVLCAKDFFVAEAALTGESLPVEKRPGALPAATALRNRSNAVYQGTNVRSGTAQMVVVTTGAHTELGGIAGRLGLRPPETEFERGVRHFGALLTEVMLVLVLLVFAVNVLLHRPAVDSLLFSLAVAVGLTPQLLPAIININLARGSEAMGRVGVIVRRLASIENFGAMDVLCSDKTGTLTSDQVSLEQTVDAEGNPSARVQREAWLNAHFQTGLANALDQAILAAALPVEGAEKLDEVPYDFQRKRLSVAVRDGGQARLITKGAFAQVLAVCTQLRQGGQVRPLEPATRQALLASLDAYGARGFRAVGLASKEVAGEHFGRDDEREMTFEGTLLFADPPQPGAAQATRDLAQLGVELKVISGDSRFAVRHAAEAIGLPLRGELTGAELDLLVDEALWARVEQVTLFSEVDPNQKERIIRALQKRNHVVGYMGDGINDAPALHAADVGISVDGAVEVARQAADFVLLRKDLGVLRRGIELGRMTFANTLKYVYMATSANFGNMFSVAGASALLKFLPMLPKQVLLINFLTDLPEMTIAGDSVDPEMLAAPRRWSVPAIRRFMVAFGLLSSVFDFVTFGGLEWIFRLEPAAFRTGWFMESVLSAVAVVLSLRTQRPLLRSRPSTALLWASGGAGLVAVALPLSPLGALLGFARVGLPVLAFVVAVVGTYVLCAELLKQRVGRRERAATPQPAFLATPFVSPRNQRGLGAGP